MDDVLVSGVQSAPLEWKVTPVGSRFVFFVLSFKDGVSFYPGWPQTHSVAEGELEDPSVSRVTELQACASTSDVCGARNQISC